MKKAEKIYLLSCLGLLLVCLLLYKPLYWYVAVYCSQPLYFYAGLLYAILAGVYFNVFFGVRGAVERIFGTILVMSFAYAVVGSLFQGIEWINDHIRIIP